MPKYQRRPEIVSAVQWFKMGDHEDVDATVTMACAKCMGIGEHGVFGDIDTVVHPGDWIVTSSTGTHVMSDSEFKEKYEAVTFDIGVTKVGEKLSDYKESLIGQCPHCGEVLTIDHKCPEWKK